MKKNLHILSIFKPMVAPCRHWLIGICALTIVCVLSACRSTKQAVASKAPHVQSQITQRKALTYAEQRRFNELFLEAIRQKEAEHIDAESELLEAALHINPLAPEALYEMGVLKLSYTAYSDSIGRTTGDSLLRKAVKMEPQNVYFKETLATYLANNADYREAIELYEELADEKEDNETLTTLIWLYKTSGDYAGAIRTIDRLERIEGKSEQLSLEKFQTYLAMKDDEHAYRAIEDLCAEYPYDLRYRVLMGDLYDQNGYHEQALLIYKDVLTAEPDNSYAQISLLAYYKAAQADSLYLDLLHRVVLNPHTQSGARIEALRGYMEDNLRNGGDSTQVLRLFNKALSQPQEDRSIAELKAYYVSEKQMPVDSLLTCMRTILSIEPDYTKARLQELLIMLQCDSMQQVAQICREGELYDPTEITFYYYEGTALYRLGRDNEAIRQLQRGVERIDDNTDKTTASDVCALLGDVLHERGLNEEAYAAYDRALTYNADNTLCLNNYAYFLSLDGKHLDRAEHMSRKAIEAEADNANYLDTYAWILYLKKDYAQANEYIREAINLAEETAEYASFFHHAGDIAYRLGNRAQALTYWKKALQLTTDRPTKRIIQRKVWRKRI